MSQVAQFAPQSTLGTPGTIRAGLRRPALATALPPAGKADAPGAGGASRRAAPVPSPTRDSPRPRSGRDAVAAAGRAVAGLDTTAQLPHEGYSAAATLLKRAKAKLTTDAILTGLLALGDSTPLSKSYRRTVDCAQQLLQEDGKLTSRYCGNRWCGICNRIRTAKLRQAYGPTLATWDVFFVTVTIPNVRGPQLHQSVRDLTKSCRIIADKIRRRDRLTWKAVRKFETTFNSERRDYHPHLHLVVHGEAAARTFVKHWLERHPDCDAKAQDVRRADPETVMRELFKYLTKQTVRMEGRTISSYPARVLDTIYKATRGMRTIQPMGFKVPKSVEEITDDDGALELTSTVSAAVGRDIWVWQPGATDWVNMNTGELLTGYEPSRSMREIVELLKRGVLDISGIPPDG